MNFAYESSDWRAMLGFALFMFGVVLFKFVVIIGLGVWLYEHRPLFILYSVSVGMLVFGLAMIVWAAVRTEEP